MNQVQHQSVPMNDAVNKLSMLAEIFFHRLLNVVDRWGCFDARPMVLRASLYTLKLDDVTCANMTEWLTQCVDAGLVKCYEVNGMTYLQVTGFKRRLGPYKTPYPEPPFEDEITAQIAVAEEPVIETVVQEVPVNTPPPLPPLAEDNKPEPGKEHEYFLNELFKPENEKVFYTLAARIKQPELKPEWIKAFNRHIRDEGNHYATEDKWLGRLRVWLPLNVDRLIKEDERATNRVKQRPRPMVL